MNRLTGNNWRFKCIAVGLFLGFNTSIQAAGSLRLNLQQNITLSGVSSGGYMANQFHIAHSDMVSGVGIISAGPYFCSQGGLMTAMGQCLADGSALADKDLSWALKNNAANKTIAPLSNLKTDKVWLLHGKLDKRVGRDVNDALYEQYQLVTDQQHIKYINDKPFNHHLPTQSFGVTCEETSTPFIGNCDYDAAGELLTWISEHKSDAKDKSAKGGFFYKTEQFQELAGEDTKLDENAWLYIPEQCAEGASCQLHVSFHGCQQNTDKIGNDYVENGGFNEWADQLNLVILYPQVASGNLLNPMSCWDWWGYTNSDFHTQAGLQIQAIKQLTDRLIAGTANLSASHQTASK